VLVGVVPSLAQHPAWPAIRGGLRACLGTDDPVFFRDDIAAVYAQAAEHLGGDRQALGSLTRSALRSGLLSAADAAAGEKRLEMALNS
jgi:adenosine deaminase